MKKENSSMRVFAALMVLVLVTCAILSTTLAKYVAGESGRDSARAAIFAYNLSAGGADLTYTDSVNLFNTVNDEQLYGTETNTGLNGDKIIAPGTWGFFDLRFRNLSEVAVSLNWGVSQAVTDGDGEDVEIPMIYFATKPNLDGTFTTAYFSEFFVVGAQVFTGDSDRMAALGLNDYPEDDFDTDNQSGNIEYVSSYTDTVAVKGSNAVANAITQGADPTLRSKVTIDGNLDALRAFISIPRIDAGDTRERVVTVGWVWPFENAGTAGGIGDRDDTKIFSKVGPDNEGAGGDDNDTSLGRGGSVIDHETGEVTVWNLDVLKSTVSATITQIEKDPASNNPPDSTNFVATDPTTLKQHLSNPLSANRAIVFDDNTDIVLTEADLDQLAEQYEDGTDVKALDLNNRRIVVGEGNKLVIQGNLDPADGFYYGLVNGIIEGDVEINLNEGDVVILGASTTNDSNVFLNSGVLIIEEGTTIQNLYLPRGEGAVPGDGLSVTDYSFVYDFDFMEEQYTWDYAGYPDADSDFAGQYFWITNNGAIGNIFEGTPGTGSTIIDAHAVDPNAEDFDPEVDNGFWYGCSSSFYDGSGSVAGSIPETVISWDDL